MSSMMGRPPAGLDKNRQEALAQLDLVKIVRAYIMSMIEEAQGYKAILLDRETMRVCSTLVGRTEFAEHNVVHVERLERVDDKAAQHPELTAIVFVRPTRESVNSLKKELRNPRYASYHVVFSNLLSSIFLQELAESDAAKEAVTSVQEFYGDFVVVGPQHFTIPCARNDLLISPKASGTTAPEYELIDRCVQGLSALFLALRRRPVIRYQRGSDCAHRLADSLYSLTYKQQYQIFDFGTRNPPVVLILDRKDDPVTPLLMQWTYQAMIHELLGIQDQTIKLNGPKVHEEFKEIVLDPQQDDFFSKHKNSNYGEVGLSVKTLVEKFQSTSEKHKQVESLEDMKRFVTEHSDFTRLQSNVTKHVNIMAALAEIVTERKLMEVSMLEQDLANPASNLAPAIALEDVSRLIRTPGVSDKDRVRVAALFALRFESDGPRLRQLQDVLVTAGVRDREPKLFAAIDALLRYAGAARRAGDLYGGRSLLNKARTMFKGLQGVENVYTQHTPLLSDTLAQLAGDRLPPAAYPYLASSQEEAIAWQASFKQQPPREVIVFIVGGTTYEEEKAVAEWNERNPATRVVLGGSAVLNCDSFLAALTSAAEATGAAGGGAAGTAAGNGSVSLEIRGFARE